MKKYILIIIVTLVVTLSSCSKKVVYECNEQDHAFVPFFGETTYTFNDINIGLLNQCNDEVDTLKSSAEKIENFFQKVDAKNTSIDPDIGAIEAYFEYYSNSRMYPNMLVDYDAFDTYNGTMELSFIFDGFHQIEVFKDHYTDPIEGELNDFDLLEDYYQMRYYVNDNYLYFVQYHTPDQTQFTVTRVYLTETKKLLYDHLSYYKESGGFNYEYSYYEEGIRGISAKYTKYGDKKGILQIKDADFITGTIEEFSISNYINPMYKMHYVNPDNMTVVHYTSENDKYILTKEIYDSKGFVYALKTDTYDQILYTYRFNLKHLQNWDYYFQGDLYRDGLPLELQDNVLINTTIKREEFMVINQHFEFQVESTTNSYNMPNSITFNELTNVQKETLDSINLKYINDYFLNIINSSNIKEVELLNVWEEYVPQEFYEFIEDNR